MFDRRPKFGAVLVAGLAISTMAVAQSASAKPNKVPLCHYDADTDTYKLISVSGNGNAVDAHLAHGDALPGDPVPTLEGHTFDDNCVPVASEVILAVAYFDTNDDGGGYDPDNDVLIAKVVDNGDGIPSDGDTIVTRRYPLDFDAAEFGSFTRTTHSGTLNFANAEFLGYSGPGGIGVFEFVIRAPGEGYVEQIDFETTTRIQDGFGIPRPPDAPGPNFDFLEARSGSPSAPDTERDLTRITTGDDPFIDVELNYTP